MKITAIVPYFGGKRTIAPQIVEAIGPHRCYFEPFCGSMAVLLSKPAVQMETVNDLHGEAVLGFLEAAKRYDRERGIRFSSYATCYAEKYIRLYVANVEARGVRFPEHRLIQAIGVMSINMSRTSGYSDNWVMHIPDRTPPDHGWTADEQWWCNALECIPSRRDREIVLRWAFGETVKSLADRFKISKERARQIRNRGLILIRRHNPRLLEDVA